MGTAAGPAEVSPVARAAHLKKSPAELVLQLFVGVAEGAGEFAAPGKERRAERWVAVRVMAEEIGQPEFEAQEFDLGMGFP